MVTAPDQSASREVSVGRRRVNLVRLAKAQRLLLRLVLGMIALYIAAGVFPHVFAGVLGGSLFYLLFLVVGVLIVVQTVRLALASGRNPVMAVFLGIGMLVPLLGLVLVASTDRRASSILRENGARVGFLGVGETEMLKLTQGYCHGCGYPLVGLVGPVCPECGGVLPRR